MSKTIFITGASTGIGAATARAAVKAGWNVGLMARSRDKLEALRAELGDQVVELPGDATDLETQERAIHQLTATFGGLDAAFANAGAGLKTPGTEKGDPAEWRRIIELNVLGLLFTARVSLPHLRKTKGHLLLTAPPQGVGISQAQSTAPRSGSCTATQATWARRCGNGEADAPS